MSVMTRAEAVEAIEALGLDVKRRANTDAPLEVAGCAGHVNWVALTPIAPALAPIDRQIDEPPSG